MESKSILHNNHWTLKNFKQRILKKQWRKILLNNQDHIIFHGKIYKLKANDLGAGVVEIYKEDKPLHEY